MIKPPYGRRAGFDRALEVLAKRASPVIVEVGMARHPNHWLEDGHSTPLFAWWTARHGGELFSLDIDPRAVEKASELLARYSIPTERAHLVCADALSWLESFAGRIDLLYLDGWDYALEDSLGAQAIRDASEAAHLACFEKAEPRLAPGALVLIDDIFIPDTAWGKGRLVIPRMRDLGYRRDPVSDTAQPCGAPWAVFQALYYRTSRKEAA